MTLIAPTLEALTAGAVWTSNEGGESGGTVWRVEWADGDAAYLKQGSGPVADAIADEAARLRWLADRVSVPAVRLFTCVGNHAWLLTDALPGISADEWLERDSNALDRIVIGCAALMRRLHALPTDECPFDAGHRIRLAAARANVAAGLVDEEDFDDDHAGWSAAAMLAETERLEPLRVERVVTHGDFSLGNILFDADGAVTGCIDVGRVGVADRYQDIAVLWQNLGEFSAAAQSLLLRELEIDSSDQQRLAFHRCLDELF